MVFIYYKLTSYLYKTYVFLVRRFLMYASEAWCWKEYKKPNPYEKIIPDGSCAWFERSLEPELDKSNRLPCPAPISRLRVEKIEGGLVVAGVVIAANCQVALSVFGCLFVLVGIVLTVASYRGPGQDEAPENYAARLAFTGNSRILGPSCIVVGLIMLTAGIALCLLTKRARRKERRIGFHCPIHGDFYPLSPVTASKALGKYESRWDLCLGRTKKFGIDDISQSPPQCPHTQMSSTRSSFSSAPISPCPTPMPFVVTSNSVSSDLVNSVGANLSPDQTFGSIRSLSVCREVASFPLSRTPSPPLQERSRSRSVSFSEKNGKDIHSQDEDSETRILKQNNQDEKENGDVVSQPFEDFINTKGTQLVMFAQAKSLDEKLLGHKHSLSQISKSSRKSVSIVLPNDSKG